MVELKNLRTDPVEREINTVIKSKYGDITIYEPRKSDVEVIMGLHEFIISLNVKDEKEKDKSTLKISDATILKDVIPLLTDIKVGDMTEEEIQDVLDNPSTAMMEVNQVLVHIITSVYKIVLLSYANELLEHDVSLESMKLNHSAVGTFVNQASETEKGKELLKEVFDEADRVNDIQKGKVSKTLQEEMKKKAKANEDAPQVDIRVKNENVSEATHLTPAQIYQEKVLNAYGDDLD
ncbi:hypothetical protein [Liquorilactobacillus mali]|uniref:Uncharacterized protein n=1 Tax=Liquorilactobacillus mali KCTC 3596 = DSM 20444 TaxID=1046596 RepID=J0KWU7_9LACO|nr:hypothetical protein [Liquorilactobacillus mali]EJE97754.1 hypothetical protein LMA_09193 [Liquorilactobacillus mali KCTC 3596 = DSM 20444]KRN10835.1 hypothetical protein FD00_GL002078 [Liquorilactobacillus mali KCTC 3596 = DSM 20444]